MEDSTENAVPATGFPRPFSEDPHIVLLNHPPGSLGTHLGEMDLALVGHKGLGERLQPVEQLLPVAHNDHIRLRDGLRLSSAQMVAHRELEGPSVGIHLQGK